MCMDIFEEKCFKLNFYLSNFRFWNKGKKLNGNVYFEIEECKVNEVLFVIIFEVYY